MKHKQRSFKRMTLFCFKRGAAAPANPIFFNDVLVVKGFTKLFATNKVASVTF